MMIKHKYYIVENAKTCHARLATSFFQDIVLLVPSTGLSSLAKNCWHCLVGVLSHHFSCPRSFFCGEARPGMHLEHLRALSSIFELLEYHTEMKLNYAAHNATPLAARQLMFGEGGFWGVAALLVSRYRQVCAKDGWVGLG